MHVNARELFLTSKLMTICFRKAQADGSEACDGDMFQHHVAMTDLFVSVTRDFVKVVEGVHLRRCYKKAPVARGDYHNHGSHAIDVYPGYYDHTMAYREH